MNALCIVPCGMKKVWKKNPDAGPTRAENVYLGQFSKKCQQYAKIFYPGHWVILSAKFGFLAPADIVPEPYDVSFNYPGSHPISVDELRKQVQDRDMDKYEEIIVLGGKVYVHIVEEVFPGKKVKAPLSGCRGNGYMMQLLNNAIRNHQKL